jgi:hypothetical protein
MTDDKMEPPTDGRSEQGTEGQVIPEQTDRQTPQSRVGAQPQPGRPAPGRRPLFRS